MKNNIDPNWDIDWKQITCGKAVTLPVGTLIWWRPNGKISAVPGNDAALYKEAN